MLDHIHCARRLATFPLIVKMLNRTIHIEVASIGDHSNHRRHFKNSLFIPNFLYNLFNFIFIYLIPFLYCYLTSIFIFLWRSLLTSVASVILSLLIMIVKLQEASSAGLFLCFLNRPAQCWASSAAVLQVSEVSCFA